MLVKAGKYICVVNGEKKAPMVATKTINFFSIGPKME